VVNDSEAVVALFASAVALFAAAVALFVTAGRSSRNRGDDK
jgi:hypothetical protein